MDTEKTHLGTGGTYSGKEVLRLSHSGITMRTASNVAELGTTVEISPDKAKAEEMLARITERMSLPDFVKADALSYYNNMSAKSMKINYTTEAKVATSVYMACRTNEVPKSINDISIASGLPHDVIKVCLRKSLVALNVVLPVQDPVRYVPALASKLDISEKDAREAMKLIEENRSQLTGRDPMSVVAAALWMSTRRSPNPKTRWEICSAAGVVDSSAKSTIERFKVVNLEIKLNMDKVKVYNKASGMDLVSEVEPLVNLVSKKLGIIDSAVRGSLKLVAENADKLENKTISTIAGAALFVAANSVYDRRTATEIAEVIGVGAPALLRVANKLEGIRDPNEYEKQVVEVINKLAGNSKPLMAVAGDAIRAVAKSKDLFPGNTLEEIAAAALYKALIESPIPQTVSEAAYTFDVDSEALGTILRRMRSSKE